MPNDEQSVYERKLKGIMKKLKIKNYTFNWDRTSCHVEFYYNENLYRLEHSVEKAQKKGIVLRNGLECLMELTQSLEDLCSIISRGLNDFETWIEGMKQPLPENNLSEPEYQEEFEIRYKSRGRQPDMDYYSEDLEEAISIGARSFRSELESDVFNRRSLRDENRY